MDDLGVKGDRPSTFCAAFTSALLVEVSLRKRPEDIAGLLQGRLMVYEVPQVFEKLFGLPDRPKLLARRREIGIDAYESGCHGESIRRLRDMRESLAGWHIDKPRPCANANRCKNEAGS